MEDLSSFMFKINKRRENVGLLVGSRVGGEMYVQ